jgi:copper(I)-binding protein
MTMSDGVMKMRKMEHGLEIKPGQTVELKPGGYHLMFTGLREGLKQGQTLKGTLQFEKAGSIEVEFHVAPIGAKGGEVGGHMSNMHMQH